MFKLYLIIFSPFFLLFINQNKIMPTTDTKFIDRETERQHLIYLNSLYIQSYIKSDTTTFDKLLWAEEFTQTNPDGRVLTRKQTMERFGQPRLEDIFYLYVKDVEVTFLNDEKAVVSAISPDCINVNGQLVKSISSYKDTYVKRSGKWKCISAVIKNMEY